MLRMHDGGLTDALPQQQSRPPPSPSNTLSRSHSSTALGLERTASSRLRARPASSVGAEPHPLFLMVMRDGVQLFIKFYAGSRGPRRRVDSDPARRDRELARAAERPAVLLQFSLLGRPGAGSVCRVAAQRERSTSTATSPVAVAGVVRCPRCLSSSCRSCCLQLLVGARHAGGTTTAPTWASRTSRSSSGKRSIKQHSC